VVIIVAKDAPTTNINISNLNHMNVNPITALLTNGASSNLSQPSDSPINNNNNNNNHNHNHNIHSNHHMHHQHHPYPPVAGSPSTNNNNNSNSNSNSNSGGYPTSVVNQLLVSAVANAASSPLPVKRRVSDGGMALGVSPTLLPSVSNSSPNAGRSTMNANLSGSGGTLTSSNKKDKKEMEKEKKKKEKEKKSKVKKIFFFFIFMVTDFYFISVKEKDKKKENGDKTGACFEIGHR
jgi:hypothetical protein